jgi:hypothetical protein
MSLLAVLFLGACADPKSDANTSGSVDPSYPDYPIPPIGPGSGTSLVPIANPVDFPNITGGTFKVTRVIRHAYSWTGTPVGLVAEGGDLYELWNNPDNINQYTYRIVKTDESGISSSYCTWSGDSSFYSGMGYDQGKLILKRNSYEFRFQRFNYSLCQAEVSLTFASQADAQGFNFLGYSANFQVVNGNFIVPFYTSSNYKLKTYDPFLFKYSDVALEQSIGGEKLSYKNSFVLHNNFLWTVTSCNLTNNTLCLWQMSLSGTKLTYAFLPKGSFPDMAPPSYGYFYYLLKGANVNELRFAVTRNSEVRYYILDISKF